MTGPDTSPTPESTREIWLREVQEIGAQFQQSLRLMRERAAPAPTPTPSALDTRVQQFEEAAALSGLFVPDQCFDASEPEELRRAVLTRARDEFTVESEGSKRRWMLRPEPRRTIVTRLVNTQTLGARITQPLPRTDSYGEILRGLLRENAGLGPAPPQTDQRTLASVVDDLRGTTLQLPDVDAIRDRIASDSFLADYRPLTEHFVGRTGELARLHQFVSGAQTAGSHSGWLGMILTGLGGAGKSALLAKFASDVTSSNAATVVLLDFDRPGIDASDQSWLQSELARQVGQQYPAAGRQLRSARAEARRTIALHLQRSQSVQEKASLGRSGDDLMFRVGDVLRDSGRPVLLVLDTLEEIVRSDARHQLMEWLSKVSSIFSPCAVRVVFSGRLFDEPLQFFERTNIVDRIDLAELEPDVAAKLLVEHGLDPGLAAQIAASNVLPRRPLELRLLARLASEGDLSIADLERDLRSKSSASAEAARAIIYQRILHRLPEGLIRDLASPGLVLRYVTPELIQGVLAPALGLPPVSDAEAEQALQRLAERTWLVTREGPERVRHRKDLRRSMLHLMVARNRATTKRISLRAIKYFMQKEPPDVAEATYHRLLLVKTPADGEQFGLLELKEAAETIGADIDDLPAPAAALCRFASAPKSVSAADVVLLPPAHFLEAYHEAGSRLANLREWGQAIRLVDQRDLLERKSNRSRAARAAGLGRWEAHTYFSTCRWRALTPRKSDPVRGNTAADIWHGLADLLYPYQLIPSSRAPWRLIEDALKFLATERRVHRSRDPQLGTAMCFATVGMAMAYSRRPMPALTMTHLAACVEPLREQLGPNPSPLVLHRLMLLACLTGKRTPLPQWLSPAALPLRRPVLEAFNSELIKFSLQSAISGVYEPSAPLTARSVLSALDSTRWGGTIEVHPKTASPMLLATFRGPDTDFSDATRFAILRAFKTPTAYRHLARVFRSVLDMPVADLDDVDMFVDSMVNDAEHALEAHIELVDRSWNLVPLIRALVEMRPNSPELSALHKAILNWDRAVRGLLKSRIPRMPDGFPDKPVAKTAKTRRRPRSLE